MIKLPFTDPGRPDTRSPVRFLLWVARHQVWTLLAGVFFGVVWMVSQALMPAAIGRAIQNGIVADDNRALAEWALILLGLGATQAAAGVMRHRCAVSNWLQASFRMAQVVGHHAARTGPAIKKQHSTGEVVATISNDAMRAGGAFDITARLAGAIVSYFVVAIILLSASVTLGLVVLIGVPILVLLMGFVIKPLQARQAVQRDEVGKLTALGADTASGLRVLRGIGGEGAFFARYRNRSQEVRQAGVRVALPQSTLDAAQVFIPGVFVVLVTWLGARFALSGKIDTGDLVAFYGYAAFLVLPLRTAAEAVDKLTRSYVGAQRMLGILEVERAAKEPARPVAEPPALSTLVDEHSGLVVQPGKMIGLVSALPDEAARIADRLGRFGDGDGVVLGDVPLAELSTDSIRRRIVVSEADPVLFSGPAPPRARPLGTDRRRRRGDPLGDRGRERRGRDRGAARGPGRLRRRARTVVLGRPAPAARARARAALGVRDARARRADERGRRAHGGEDRAPPARGAGRQDDRRDHGEPADARPDRPRRLRRGRARRRRGHAPRAAEDEPGLHVDGHAG